MLDLTEKNVCLNRKKLPTAFYIRCKWQTEKVGKTFENSHILWLHLMHNSIRMLHFELRNSIENRVLLYSVCIPFKMRANEADK